MWKILIIKINKNNKLLSWYHFISSYLKKSDNRENRDNNVIKKIKQKRNKYVMYL